MQPTATALSYYQKMVQLDPSVGELFSDDVTFKVHRDDGSDDIEWNGKEAVLEGLTNLLFKRAKEIKLVKARVEGRESVVRGKSTIEYSREEEGVVNRYLFKDRNQFIFDPTTNKITSVFVNSHKTLIES